MTYFRIYYSPGCAVKKKVVTKIGGWFMWVFKDKILQDRLGKEIVDGWKTEKIDSARILLKRDGTLIIEGYNIERVDIGIAESPGRIEIDNTKVVLYADKYFITADIKEFEVMEILCGDVRIVGDDVKDIGLRPGEAVGVLRDDDGNPIALIAYEAYGNLTNFRLLKWLN